MVVLVAMAVGAVWGVLYQRRRGGNGKDMAQYGAVWALIGAIIGVVVAVGLDNFI